MVRPFPKKNILGGENWQLHACKFFVRNLSNSIILHLLIRSKGQDSRSKISERKNSIKSKTQDLDPETPAPFTSLYSFSKCKKVSDPFFPFNFNFCQTFRWDQLWRTSSEGLNESRAHRFDFLMSNTKIRMRKKGVCDPRPFLDNRFPNEGEFRNFL